jgi:endonuclease YncB( thermonuclease family)
VKDVRSWSRSLRLAPAALIVLAVILPRATARADGAPTEASDWAEGPVEISRIHRPDVIEIRRGDATVSLRLAGIDGATRTDRDLFRTSLARVRHWLESDGIVLMDPKPDPRKGMSGRLRLADGSDVSRMLLLEGLALFDPTGIDADTADLLREAQASARGRERGLWGFGRQGAADAERYYDRIVTLCGETTTAVRESDGSWLVTVGERYPRREVGIRIPAHLASEFHDPGRSLPHRQVCVTGRVRETSLGPEIVAASPSQITDRGHGGSY